MGLFENLFSGVDTDSHGASVSKLFSSGAYQAAGCDVAAPAKEQRSPSGRRKLVGAKTKGHAAAHDLVTRNPAVALPKPAASRPHAAAVEAGGQTPLARISDRQHVGTALGSKKRKRKAANSDEVANTRSAGNETAPATAAPAAEQGAHVGTPPVPTARKAAVPNAKAVVKKSKQLKSAATPQRSEGAAALDGVATGHSGAAVAPPAPGSAAPPHDMADNAQQATAKASAEYAEELARTVFVGNVSLAQGQGQAKKGIKAYFKRHGNVAHVRLRSLPLDTASKLPRAVQVKAGKVNDLQGTTSAYVTFTAAEGARAALAANMEVHEGLHLRVDMAAAPKSKQAGAVQYDAKRSVFVGNLAFDVTEEQVIGVFNSGRQEPQLAGALEAVRVVRDAKTSIGKGIAYVLFKRRNAALAALNLDGADCEGRSMRVQRVKAAPSDAKGLNTLPPKPNSHTKPGASKPGKRTMHVGGNADDFGGLRVKGKHKAAGGAKLAGVQKLAQPRASSAALRSGGKRPAVAARKAAALAAAGELTAAQVKQHKQNEHKRTSK